MSNRLNRGLESSVEPIADIVCGPVIPWVSGHKISFLHVLAESITVGIRPHLWDWSDNSQVSFCSASSVTVSSSSSPLYTGVTPPSST